MEKVNVYIDPRQTNIIVHVNNLTGDKNVQSDWLENNDKRDSYIRNKPFIAQSTSQLINDVPFITQEEFNLVLNTIPNGLISGGIVTWSGVGFKYFISQALVKINNVIYSIPAGEVTLTASHATFDRVDLIYVTSTGFGFKTGTPAENPIIPQLEDLDTQIALTSIIVQANTTEPIGITSEDVYQENEEWTTQGTISGVLDFENEENPESGVKAIKLLFQKDPMSPNPNIGAFLGFNNEAPFTTTDRVLTFKLWLTVPYEMADADVAQITYVPFRMFLRDVNGTMVSSVVNLLINPNLTEVWQTISYDLNNLSLIGIPSEIILIARTQNDNSVLYIDNITLQSGIDQVTPVNEHNALAGKQKSHDIPNEYYHLSEAGSIASEQLADPDEELEPTTLVTKKNGEVKETPFDILNTYVKQNNFGNFNGGFVDVAYDSNLDRIYVVGVFTEYKGLPAPGIIRLMPDGEIDPEFVVGTGFSGGNIGSNFTRTQKAIWVLSDSTLFIGGGFTIYNGTTVNRIVKLLPNGSIDASFASGTAITGFSLTVVSSLYVDEVEEKVVLVGLFSTWNGNSSVRDCVIKVGFDGVLDETFSIGTGASSSGTNVLSIAEIDGSYFISGFFLNYGGSSAPRIARINKTTGAFESSFVSQAQGGGTHIDHYITPYLGKILLTGGFVTYAGQDKRRIVLLNLDGSIDTSFNVEPGFARLNNAIDNFNTSAYLVRPYVEDNNTILIPVVESLQQYNGRPISNIVRLSTTGELLNNYGYENAPKYLITKIGSTYYAYSIPAFDPLGHGVNSFSPLNSNFVAQFEYKGYIQDENGHITSSSNLETTEAQTQSNFITRRDTRGLIKSFFHNFTTMFNPVLRLFNLTKANIETEPEHYVAIKNGEIIKTAIPSPPTLPTNTSDLTNDGEDGVNPFITANDVDESKWDIVFDNQYGLRLPTETEWDNERLSWGSNNSAGAFASPLKLPVSGVRSNTNGSLFDVGTFGYYWSSSVKSEPLSGTVSGILFFTSSAASTDTLSRAYGSSVRLIVNGTFTLAEFQADYENETFEFQGLDYGFVYNSTTERIWLDRNLGASQVAASSTDSDSYGDLYQWGRSPDGHQVRTSALHDGDVDGKPTFAKESGDWDGKFITTTSSINDWLDPQDNNLWQGLDGFNESFDIGEKLIGKDGLKASYLDLQDLPDAPDPTTLQEAYDEEVPDLETDPDTLLAVKDDEVVQYDIDNINKYIIPTLTDSNEITFDRLRVFGELSDPRTGTLTDDLTGGLQGIVQKIYLDEDDIPAGWILIGGELDDSGVNIIFCELNSEGDVEYWVTQEQ